MKVKKLTIKHFIAGAGLAALALGPLGSLAAAPNTPGQQAEYVGEYPTKRPTAINELDLALAQDALITLPSVVESFYLTELNGVPTLKVRENKSEEVAFVLFNTRNYLYSSLAFSRDVNGQVRTVSESIYQFFTKAQLASEWGIKEALDAGLPLRLGGTFNAQTANSYFLQFTLNWSVGALPRYEEILPIYNGWYGSYRQNLPFEAAVKRIDISAFHEAGLNNAIAAYFIRFDGSFELSIYTAGQISLDNIYVTFYDNRDEIWKLADFNEYLKTQDYTIFKRDLIIAAIAEEGQEFYATSADPQVFPFSAYFADNVKVYFESEIRNSPRLVGSSFMPQAILPKMPDGVELVFTFAGVRNLFVPYLYRKTLMSQEEFARTLALPTTNLYFLKDGQYYPRVSAIWVAARLTATGEFIGQPWRLWEPYVYNRLTPSNYLASYVHDEAYIREGWSTQV